MITKKRVPGGKLRVEFMSEWRHLAACHEDTEKWLNIPEGRRDTYMAAAKVFWRVFPDALALHAFLAWQRLPQIPNGNPTRKSSAEDAALAKTAADLTDIINADYAEVVRKHPKLWPSRSPGE